MSAHNKSTTMKFATITLYALSIVSLTFAQSTDVTSNDIPFYLKQSTSDPNGVIAVVYYGEKGDTSKEIDVPCSLIDAKTTSTTDTTTTFGGPESMSCQCESIRRSSCSYSYSSSHNTKLINNSKCQLQAPFRFERSTDGTITSVTFEQDSSSSANTEMMSVPFYPQTDKDGNIVAVSFPKESEYSTASAVMSLLVWFLIIVSSIAVLVTLVRVVRYLFRRNNNKAATGDNNNTINPMNVKNLSDLENPQAVDSSRNRGNNNNNNNDDDTVTDAGSDN
jgi:hypothetical protein